MHTIEQIIVDLNSLQAADFDESAFGDSAEAQQTVASIKGVLSSSQPQAALLNLLQQRQATGKQHDPAGPERLQVLTDELLTSPQAVQAIPALFNLLERLADVDLGEPGPAVRALEKMRGHYEAELVSSLKRRPTYLSVSMVNRILNSKIDPAQRATYLELLRSVAKHPRAPTNAKESAQEFLQFQTENG